MTTPATMKLTYDTLLHVISLTAHVRDSLQLMATCRVLYHEGAKVALKEPITIYNEEQLASFLRFLRAEGFFRCRYLRQLNLWDLYPEPEGIEELIETLPYLTNVEFLRLNSTEELLQPFPALAPAFATLTGLRRIDLWGAKEAAIALLSSLRSPLISVCVDFLRDDDEKMWEHLPIDEWSLYHPTTVLAGFAATLEELQCVAWYTNEDTVIPTKVYPNMRKLAIELHDFPLRIDPFIRAFPNLTDISLSTEYHGGYISGDMQESHDANIAQQLDPVHSCGTWAHLQHFSGSLFDLYTIGLACHITRVAIGGDPLRGGSMARMLATVLRYARPVHLKLESIAGSILRAADGGFISILRDVSASNLINLNIRIYFGADDREKDLAEVLDDLFLALGRLPLKFLELKVHTQDLDPTPRGIGTFQRRRRAQLGLPTPPEPVLAPPTRAELSLDALDKGALVVRLAESLAALEVAHVVILSSRRGGEGFEKTVTKGTLQMAGREQWLRWTPGKNCLVY